MKTFEERISNLADRMHNITQYAPWDTEGIHETMVKELTEFVTSELAAAAKQPDRTSGHEVG